MGMLFYRSLFIFKGARGRTAKVEQTMQGVIVLEPGAVQPRILYRMLFERGLKDQCLRCSLHRILGTVS